MSLFIGAVRHIPRIVLVLVMMAAFIAIPQPAVAATTCRWVTPSYTVVHNGLTVARVVHEGQACWNGLRSWFPNGLSNRASAFNGWRVRSIQSRLSTDSWNQAKLTSVLSLEAPDGNQMGLVIAETTLLKTGTFTSWKVIFS